MSYTPTKASGDGFRRRPIVATDFRSRGARSTAAWRHDAEFLFTFVLAGTLTLRADGAGRELGAGAAFVLPAGMSASIAGASADLEFLEVSLPAVFETLEIGTS